MSVLCPLCELTWKVNNTTIKETEGVKIKEEKENGFLFSAQRDFELSQKVIIKMWGRIGQGGCAKQTEINKRELGLISFYLLNKQHKKRPQ